MHKTTIGASSVHSEPLNRSNTVGCARERQGYSTMEVTEKLLLTAEESANLVGLSRSKFYELRSSGRVPAPIRLGGSVRWRKQELVEWVEAGCPSRIRWEEIRQSA